MTGPGITLRREPALKRELEDLGRIAICVSGGIDSEVLIRAAAEVLGTDSIAAVMAITPFIAERHVSCAESAACSLGIRLHRVPVNLLSCLEIRNNTPERCYHCKSMIYSALISESASMGFSLIADGTNLDDTGKHRPGLKAAREHSVQHPMVSAGMNKERVRDLGRALGIPDADRPEDSCLVTRLPANRPVEADLLRFVAEIEQSAGAAARGRLRAVPGNGIVTLEFETVDISVIERLCKGIAEFCETYRAPLLLKNTDFTEDGTHWKDWLYNRGRS